jgi:hypothetical protein
VVTQKKGDVGEWGEREAKMNSLRQNFELENRPSLAFPQGPGIVDPKD